MDETTSLERLVPDAIAAHESTGRETLELHLERYRFAARHLRPGRLLDVACGVGYGTRLMADAVPAVESALGLDIDAGAVEYARGRYADARTRYERRDAMTLDVDARFDSIVSLETIEHLPEPEPFVAKLAQLLASGGVLVASVPTTPSVDLNPHHLHDFSARSFRALLARQGLRELDALEQVQSVNPVAVLRRSETRMETMRRGLAGYYLRHPGSLLRRVGATLRHGFCNKYLTVVCQRAS